MVRLLRLFRFMPYVIWGEHMPAYKLTMIFQVTTQPQGSAAIPRTAGWTESVYNGVLTSATRASFARLQQARAALLPPSAAIIGQRYQVVLPTGGSSTSADKYPGTAYITPGDNLLTDIPSVGLLIKSNTNTVNVASRVLRGLPDDWVQGGELRQFSPIQTAINAYFGQLTGWSMLGRNLTAPRIPIFNIEGTTLTLVDPTALTVGGVLRISRAKDVNGILRSATVRVVAALTTSTYTIQGWTYGDTTDGQLRDVTPDIHAITTSSVARVVTKKVGRPLFVFHGKRSKRRP